MKGDIYKGIWVYMLLKAMTINLMPSVFFFNQTGKTERIDKDFLCGQQKYDFLLLPQAGHFLFQLIKFSPFLKMNSQLFLI